MLLDSAPHVAKSKWLPEVLAYGLAGVAVQAGGHMLTGADSFPLIVLVSILRLWVAAAAGEVLVCIIRRDRFRTPSVRLLAALAYPVDLSLFAFTSRTLWLPEPLLDYTFDATTFPIVISGLLLLTLLLTRGVIQSVGPERLAPMLRTTVGVLFLLTSVGVAIVPAPSTMAFLRTIAEPVALSLYAGILGYSRALDTLAPGISVK